MDPTEEKRHEIVRLHMQWHITSSCNYRCRHCYMYDSGTAANERNTELTFAQILGILDDIAGFEEKYACNFERFFLTGGDPLLRRDWEDIVAELHRRGKEVRLMGNPDTLTEETVEKLVDLGIRTFQLSLDGLQESHDYMRGQGSFELARRKIALLRAGGLDVNVMFTLFRQNSQDLIPLVDYVAMHTQASSFSFDMGCLAGGALKSRLEDPNPRDVAGLFRAYHERQSGIQRLDFKLREKSNLHRLERYARGEFYPVIPDSYTRVAGCLAGWSGLCLLSNGAAMACRRLPVVVGKMPEQTVEEIFLGNAFMRKLRRHEFFEGCSQCQFYAFCRGCPAATYGVKGDPFAANPHCFASEVAKPCHARTQLRASPPMDASNHREMEFLRSNTTFFTRYKDYLLRNSFQNVFFPLLYRDGEEQEFIEDPFLYLERRRISLGNDEIAWLMYYFSENRIRIRYDIEMLGKETRLKTHGSLKPSLSHDGERMTVSLRGKTISVSAGAGAVMEQLLTHEEYTAGEVLKWDDGFDWASVRHFLHAMLEELVICYAPR